MAVNLLRFQIAVVYIFAGLAKISADWLLDAQPLRIWLAARSDLPIVGPFVADPWVAYGFSWFGAAYDLTIVFFLLSRMADPDARFRDGASGEDDGAGSVHGPRAGPPHRRRWRSRGIANVEGRADSFASLNGRPLQRLIDPDVDLAASEQPSEWIVPRKREPQSLAEGHQE